MEQQQVGKWMNDEELGTLLGDEWFEEMEVSRETHEDCVATANEWLEQKGAKLRVTECRDSGWEDNLDWFVVEV